MRLEAHVQQSRVRACSANRLLIRRRPPYGATEYSCSARSGERSAGSQTQMPSVPPAGARSDRPPGPPELHLAAGGVEQPDTPVSHEEEMAGVREPTWRGDALARCSYPVGVGTVPVRDPQLTAIATDVGHRAGARPAGSATASSPPAMGRQAVAFVHSRSTRGAPASGGSFDDEQAVAVPRPLHPRPPYERARDRCDAAAAWWTTPRRRSPARPGRDALDVR